MPMGDTLITNPVPEFIHEPQLGEKRVPNAPSQTHTLKPADAKFCGSHFWVYCYICY